MRTAVEGRRFCAGKEKIASVCMVLGSEGPVIKIVDRAAIEMHAALLIRGSQVEEQHFCL